MEEPFSLAQVDTKEILDKGTLGTRRWMHLLRKRLPRYQWTYLEGKTPFEKLKESGYDLPEEFAVFPLVILDTISTEWLLQTGNDLLADYTACGSALA